MHYLIPKTEPFDPGQPFDSEIWQKAAVAEISIFRPEGSDHHPQAQARLLYDSSSLHVIFSVKDRYVRCVYTTDTDPVYKDSCAELFIMPVFGKGYFNFEFNACGIMLCSYIEDPVRTPDGFRKQKRLSPEELALVKRASSLHGKIDPEITGDRQWFLEARIPFSLLEAYTGPLQIAGGIRWSGNLYKCGDETSHPHWASWAPVEKLNFHAPQCFGTFEFG
jgi:hypothetical protein